MADGDQPRESHGANGAVGRQRVLSGLGRARSMDIYLMEPLPAEQGLFSYHCVCPNRPTRRAMFSPGSQGEYEGVKIGLRTFKTRYKLQPFQQITLI